MSGYIAFIKKEFTENMKNYRFPYSVRSLSDFWYYECVSRKVYAGNIIGFSRRYGNDL